MKTNQDQLLLAQAIFKDNQLTVEQIINRYPSRLLPEGAMVTRIAPSPTGYMHIGTLYVALISEVLAHQTSGVFFLRIEDTDKKREVPGAAELVSESLQYFNIKTDEGMMSQGMEIGEYGPYTQSLRAEIYKAFAKELVSKGLAYPCFATTEELETMANMQTDLHTRPGYYGKWAIWRERSIPEALKAIEEGRPFVIRFRSSGNNEDYFSIKDVFKGDLDLPQNDLDIVLLKSDGLPTYHFAHVVDDHLMGTTHVLRGDEWLSSLPIHVQLFESLGWNPPQYGHVAPIQKLEDKSRRKLSKRKDPEANIDFYKALGYPVTAIKSYLLNLANSSYEEWRQENPTAKTEDYELSMDELKKGAGSLLDMDKLNDIAKNEISYMSATDLYELTLAWAQAYAQSFANLLMELREYVIRIFQIERGIPNARKDIAKFSDVMEVFRYFFDDLFDSTRLDLSQLSDVNKADMHAIASDVATLFSADDSKDIWLEKMRNIGEKYGYAPSMKAYKTDPRKYKGHFGTVAKIIRVLLTGTNQSPDLYEVMVVMGEKRIKNRLIIEQ